MTNAEDRAKKKVLYALADLLASSKKGILVTLLCTVIPGALFFKDELKDKAGFKRPVTDTVEFSEEDQKLLMDVARQTDITAAAMVDVKEAVKQLAESQGQLAQDFRLFLMSRALQTGGPRVAERPR